MELAAFDIDSRSSTEPMNGRVSIVIPCFNHGRMLRETLESVERSRNANLAEVIIVNDGSTDEETCNYLDELAESNYRVIHQPNRGLAAARNAGIRTAQAEFILPLDSDNLIREPYLKRGVEVLIERTEIGVVYADAEFFGEKTGRRHFPDFDLRRIVIENYIDACALFRRSAWESVNGYDEEMRTGWEDWDFWMRLALRGWGFMHLDPIAFDYRVRRGQMGEDAAAHRLELTAYIFGKPEYRMLRIIREQGIELESLTAEYFRITNSMDYRVGRSIASPFKRLRRLLYGGKN